MQELESLLNSLIQQGWKPKDREVVSIKLDQEFTKSEGKTVFYCNCKEGFGFYVDLRWLVSLESGLWRFVYDNKMIKQSSGERTLNPTYGPEGADCDWSIQSNEAQYRLLESALVPEEELAQFLIDNIKTEN